LSDYSLHPFEPESPPPDNALQGLSIRFSVGASPQLSCGILAESDRIRSTRACRLTLPPLHTTNLDPELNNPANRIAAPPPTAGLSERDTRIVRVCLIMVAALSVGTLIGVASSPYLVNNHPHVLIGISPLSRHMVLVAPLIGAPMVLLVGGLRSLAFTAASYFLGRSLGEPGLLWLEQRAEKAGRFVRWLEEFFQRWSYLAVFVFPLGVMACIAGIARMRPYGFFAAATAGITVRLSLYVLLADSIREPLMRLLEFIRVYQVPATVVLGIGIGTHQVYRRTRRGGQGA
jgi:membrane protein DedA with SNARE-associated domain